MAEICVGAVADYGKRDRKVLVAGRFEVGVFRLGDAFYAYENRCAHMAGPVCQGRVLERVEEVIRADKTAHGFRFAKDRVNIVCPWHGYEYDIRTGRHQGNDAVQLTAFPVRVAAGKVYVTLPD
jgi:nitrite reductase (NADH) small subunit